MQKLSRGRVAVIAAAAILIALGVANARIGSGGRYAALQLPVAAPDHGSAPLAPLAPQLAPPGFVKKTSCAAVAMSRWPAAELASGSIISLTAAASGCPAATFEFWELAPGSRWSIVQDYGPSSSLNPRPLTDVGTYKFEVDVRDASATSAYDATAVQSVVVVGCSAARLTPSTPSPHRSGSSIELTAAATCPGTPAYRFLARPPGGAWRVVQDYSSSAVFDWTPATAGTWSLEVDVRDQGATAAYEAAHDITYTVG